ncbi:MFS transporter [Actinomycetospora soli]|uniref:MFS transporter n=1 Tax=Actinomycetospora soli TaxID=2893887 RepID=UPI001E56BE25|nr:MFS transporter [Actinomycetospora soli]MCD2189626.1 MFS transporter [Actinomycetospora soli]
MIATLRSVRSFPRAVQVLLLNQLGVNTGFYLLVPYLSGYLGGELGLSAALVGVVLGVRNLSQQGLFLVGGSAADRLGARGVIIAGCALRTVGFGLFALGESVPILFAAAILSGLAGALFNPAVRAYLSQEAGERKAEAFALFNVFANTGALLGPLLGGVLLLVGFRLSAIVAAVLFALLTIWQLAVLPVRRIEPSGTTVGGDWREVLTCRPFLAFTLAMVGMFALQNQLYLLLPLQAAELTGSASPVAVIFAVVTLLNLGLQVRLTRRLDAAPRATTIAAGLAVMGLAFLLPALLAPLVPPGLVGLVPVLLAAAVFSVGLMIAQPFVNALIGSFTRPGLSGTCFGVFYLASGITAAAANALIGWAVDAAGSPVAWLPAVVCAAFGFGSALAARLLATRLPQEVPT